jgi:hypothetical protein
MSESIKKRYLFRRVICYVAAIDFIWYACMLRERARSQHAHIPKIISRGNELRKGYKNMQFLFAVFLCFGQLLARDSGCKLISNASANEGLLPSAALDLPALVRSGITDILSAETKHCPGARKSFDWNKKTYRGGSGYPQPYFDRLLSFRDGNRLPVDVGNQQSEIPIKVRWQLLTSIKYEPKYFPEVEMEMLSPIFTDTIKKLNGKLIEIEGYVIPFDEDITIFALSANPYASCFFCGKASPASVMTLKMAFAGKRFKTDEFLKFVGRLRLNFNDPQEFYYVLEKAKVL